MGVIQHDDDDAFIEPISATIVEAFPEQQQAQGNSINEAPPTVVAGAANPSMHDMESQQQDPYAEHFAEQYMEPQQHQSLSNNSNDFSVSESSIRRRTFLSRHRQDLDHLETDAAHNCSHPIPEPTRPLEAQNPQMQQQTATRDSLDRWDRIQSTMTNFTQLPKTPDALLTFFLPAWRWLKQYNLKTSLRKDIIAGLTVGVMVIPQGMSYAKLAGLPVQFGLYSAIIPVYMYALFGSSRQLAIGPVSMIALLLNTGLTTIMRNNYAQVSEAKYQSIYLQLALQTSFLVGLINIFLGLARLGFVTNFLSRAVISGFTTGAAVIIGCTQLPSIFGFGVTYDSIKIHKILQAFFRNIHQTNWKSFVLGTVSVLLLVLLKHIGKARRKYRWVQALGPLTVTVIGIVFTVGMDLDVDANISVVEDIPKGFPQVSARDIFPMNHFRELILPVISITLFGFMESVAIAKRLAATHRYEIDSSLELIGLGVANLSGSMFQAFPVTGSFSRSTINNDCGAESGIAGVVTATLVLVVVIFFVKIFERLPLCTLSAIVMSGVFGLLDYAEAIKLWKVHKKDFVCWMCAFVGTLFSGVEIGLLLSIGVSVLIVLYESAYPHTAVLGRLPSTSVYRNIKQYPDAEEYIGILIIRVDAPLYFANAQNVREKIRKYRLAAEEDTAYEHGDVKFLILDLTPVSHIDTTALHCLEDMCDNYKSRNQQLCFCNPSLVVMKRFDDIGFTEKVGRKFFFSCTHDAVKWCLAEMDTDATSAHETQLQTSDGAHGSRTNCNDDLGCPVRVTRLAPLEVVFDA